MIEPFQSHSFLSQVYQCRLNGFRPVSASRGTWLKPGVNETGAGEHHELTFEAKPYASVFCIDRTDRKHMFRGSDSNIGGVAAKLKTSPAGKPEAYRYVLRQSRTSEMPRGQAPAASLCQLVSQICNCLCEPWETKPILDPRSG